MKTKILALVMALGMAQVADAGSMFDDWDYDMRAGYSIGGAMPLDMPATIRELNSYDPRFNFSVGMDAYKVLKGRWGLLTGLRIEKKGMYIDATVKNYHMEMSRGGETLEGVFTGRNSSKMSMWMITIPLEATCNIGENVRLRIGPYISLLTSNEFSGYAYDGYMRVNNPTGTKVDIGSDEGTRGTYDFSDDMRRVQYGIQLGADWRFYRQWGAFADVSWGINGIYHSNFKTIEQTLYPIYGTIGLTYKIK